MAYSPSGASLAFAGHDASISVVTNGQVQTIKLPCLPLTQLLFLDEAKLIGAGHDANPALFAKQNEWAFARFLVRGQSYYRRRREDGHVAGQGQDGVDPGRVGGLDGLEEAPGARDLPQKKWKWVLDDGVRRAPRGVGALSLV